MYVKTTLREKNILCTTQRTLQKIYFHDIAVLLKMQLTRTLPMSQRRPTTLMEVGFIGRLHCLNIVFFFYHPQPPPNSLSISSSWKPNR